MLGSTHTHSQPGGFLNYLMYNIPSLGFVEQNVQTIVNGIVRSIERAHHSMTEGKILINSGQLLDANINRSPTAYVRNPKEERDKYGSNTDTDMTVLKLVSTNGQYMGAITWFSVHCTSMNNTNHLISGDNKGYASMRFENEINGGTLVGKVCKFITLIYHYWSVFMVYNLFIFLLISKGPICSTISQHQ